MSLVGAYAATLDMATVWKCIIFGVLGWLMMKFDIPRAPLVLALVLAPLMETSLRQSLLAVARQPDDLCGTPDRGGMLLVAVCPRVSRMWTPLA
jgi:putative tricarboxylic transport membrane protein